MEENPHIGKDTNIHTDAALKIGKAKLPEWNEEELAEYNLFLEWEYAFKKANEYAIKKDAIDRQENNIQESGYWFWFKLYLTEHYKIIKKGK